MAANATFSKNGGDIIITLTKLNTPIKVSCFDANGTKIGEFNRPKDRPKTNTVLVGSGSQGNHLAAINYSGTLHKISITTGKTTSDTLATTI